MTATLGPRRRNGQLFDRVKLKRALNHKSPCAVVTNMSGLQRQMWAPLLLLLAGCVLLPAPVRALDNGLSLTPAMYADDCSLLCTTLYLVSSACKLCFWPAGCSF